MEKILDALRKQPDITQRVLAKGTGISLPKVNTILQQLRDEGKIVREGTSKKGSWVIVLYTDFTPYMSYEDCFRLAENRDRFIPIKCYAGEKAASALDFQLVSIAGFLMKEYSESEYIILSKDKGYDPMVRFWQDAGYYVTREVPTKLAAGTASEQMELTDVIVVQPDSTTAGLSKKEKKRRRDAIVVGALPNADKDTRTKVKAMRRSLREMWMQI